MRCAEVQSAHHERPWGVANFLQCVEYPVDAATADARDILSRNPTRSHFACETHEIEEKSRSLPVDALAAGVGGAGVLARGGTAEDVDAGDSIGSKPGSANCSNVIVHPDMGEVAGEPLAPPRVDLAGGDGGDSSPVESEAPAAGRPAEGIEASDRHDGRDGNW
jgi:hypothetical protein